MKLKILGYEIEFYKCTFFYYWGYTKLPNALVIELGNYAIDVIKTRGVGNPQK